MGLSLPVRAWIDEAAIATLSARRREPGKSSSASPGSLLPESRQPVRLNKGRKCCSLEPLMLAPMLLHVFCREALRLCGGASPCDGMQNGNQNTGADECNEESAPEAKCLIGDQDIHDQSTNKGSHESDDQITNHTKPPAKHDDAY